MDDGARDGAVDGGAGQPVATGGPTGVATTTRFSAAVAIPLAAPAVAGDVRDRVQGAAVRTIASPDGRALGVLAPGHGRPRRARRSGLLAVATVGWLLLRAVDPDGVPRVEGASALVRLAVLCAALVLGACAVLPVVVEGRPAVGVYAGPRPRPRPRPRPHRSPSPSRSASSCRPTPTRRGCRPARPECGGLPGAPVRARYVSGLVVPPDPRTSAASR